MSSIEEMSERILYWLSLDMEVRALAERLLQRFADTVGDLPASAEHHHSEAGGLYRHSLEVALKALEEFEGNIVMERRPDGSVDSFRSSRNRPRWQYATFDPNDRSSKPRLMFRPDALRESGIPDALIEAAARSNPPGLVLFEDLPKSKDCADQPTPQSTR